VSTDSFAAVPPYLAYDSLKKIKAILQEMGAD